MEEEGFPKDIGPDCGMIFKGLSASWVVNDVVVHHPGMNSNPSKDGDFQLRALYVGWMSAKPKNHGA